MPRSSTNCSHSHGFPRQQVQYGCNCNRDLLWGSPNWSAVATTSFTVKEAAKGLGLRRASVYKICERDELPPYPGTQCDSTPLPPLHPAVRPRNAQAALSVRSHPIAAAIVVVVALPLHH